jgi:peptidoglycan/LPS O-acetylase OafA/YrhL
MDTSKRIMTRLPQIDIFRGVAFLLVLFSHCHVSSGIRYPIYINLGFIRHNDITNLLGFGYIGVDFFFVISGFCLSLPYFIDNDRKLNWIVFLKRRVLRVYPAFTASFLLLLLSGWIIRFFISDDSLLPVFAKPTAIFRIITGYLLQTTEMNGSFWTLCLEMRWYLLFPLVLSWARRFGALYLLAASLFVCFLIPQGLDLHGPLKVPVYLPSLIAGIAVAEIFSQQKKPVNQLVIRYAWLGFIIFMGVTFWILPGPFDPGRGSIAEVLPTTGLFSFLVLMGVKWQRLNYFGRWLELIGIYSYSLYLIHQPLIEFLGFILKTEKWTSPWSLIYSLIFLPSIMLVFGYLFYIVFERPFLNLGKNKPLNKVFHRHFN